MHTNSLRTSVDKLVDLAGKIYYFLGINEQNLLQSCMQELGQKDAIQSNIWVRKRVLRYMILDTHHAEFQSLWSEYQALFRLLYRDFSIQSYSPMNDELFASREIIEDALEQVTETKTFKYVFLQKAYQCFGLDFKPINSGLTEVCLFSIETAAPDPDETLQNNYEDSEDSNSHVCFIM